MSAYGSSLEWIGFLAYAARPRDAVKGGGTQARLYWAWKARRFRVMDAMVLTGKC